MSRCLPRIIRATIASIVLLTVGCAAPTELSFDDAGTGGADDVGTPVLPNAESSMSLEQAPPDGVVDGSSDTAGESATDDTAVAAVETAFARLLPKWIDCFHAPADCNPSAITAPDSPERARLAEAAAFYAAEQIRTKPDEGRLEWGVEALSTPGEGRARLVTCEYDTRVFFDSSMASTELGDIIFDTTIWTRRVEWTLARNDGEWKLWSRRIDRRSPIARFCTP